MTMDTKQNDETYTTTQKVTKTAVLVFTWLTIVSSSVVISAAIRKLRHEQSILIDKNTY